MGKGSSPSYVRDSKHHDEYPESQDDAESLLGSARKSILASAKRMARAEVDSVLQSEILTALIDGRRTLAELVEEIYSVGKENPGYQMYYARVRRGAKNLSSKGLVSEGLIRKYTPYRLTKYGVSKLLQIGEPAEEYRIASRQDYMLFAVSGLLLGSILLAGIGIWKPGTDVLKVLFSLFFVSAGAALLRLSQMLRNVA